MKRFATSLFYYPVELAVLFLFKPLFSDYLSIVIPAILFFYAACGVVFYLKLNNIKGSIWLTFLIKYLIVIALSAIFIFCNTGMISTIIFGILCAALIYFGYREKAEISKSIRGKILYGALIVLIIPLFFILAQSFFASRETKSLDQDYAYSQNNFSDQLKKYDDKANLFATDPTIANDISTENYSSLTQYAQSLMVGHNLSYVLITGKDGTVLTRAHRPAAVGDNIFKTYTPSGNALTGQKFEGLFNFGEDKPFLASGKPIMKDNILIGGIFAGSFVSDDLLKDFPKEKGYLVETNNEAVAVNQNSVANSLYSSSLTDIAKKEIGLLKDNDNYIYKTFSLNSPENKEVAKVIILKADTSASPAAIFLYVIVSVLAAIYIYSLWSYVQFHDTSVGPDFSRIDQIKHLVFFAPALLICLLISFSASKDLTENASRFEISSLPNKPVSSQPLLYIKNALPFAKTNSEITLELFADSKRIDSGSIIYTINFPKELLSAVEITPSTKFCSKIINKEISNEKGELSVACDLASRNSLYEPELIANIKFKANKSGIANVSILDKESYILTSNGNQGKIQQTFPDGEHILISN